jgi:hypothetical protein
MLKTQIHLGRPILMDARFGAEVRIVLPNVALAFDYSQKDKKIVGVWSITTSRKFEKLD